MGLSGLGGSDWNAIGKLVPHGFACDLKEAAQRSALVSVDMDMTSDAYHHHLVELVREGSVPLIKVDETVRRVLRLKVMLGLFDH